MKKHLTPLEQENCDRNCAECWESDVFGNCYKKCENCEYDWTPDCFFGQWCRYWDGHGMPEIPEKLRKKQSLPDICEILNDDLPF